MDSLEITISKLQSNFELFCLECMKIKGKDGSVIPLRLNEAQRYFLKRLKEQEQKKGLIRLVVVKGRQQGLSTLIQAYYFWRVIFQKGYSAFILTHETEATKNLFNMTKRYYDNFPFKDMIPTTEDSATSLFFEGMESGYKVGTAGNKSVGRSQTLQLFHGSECAFWPHAHEHASGILQTIPYINGTAIIFESTANGIGNFFYDKYKESLENDSDYELVFIPWYWQKEYRREVFNDFIPTIEEKQFIELYGVDYEQLNWRRYKIKELNTTGVKGELKFKQEYPFSAEEAFIATSYNSYLSLEPIKKAASNKDYIEAYGPLILGVDPSGAGKDKTGFCLRTGRIIHDVWGVNTKDEMEVVGLIVQLIKERPIKYCFIDTIGIGAGIASRLLELGYSSIVRKVNAAEQALNRELYMNLRAEMWANLREWLEDAPCQMPDNPELITQMMSVGYGADSKGRLKIEAKDDIKKDGRPSPDLADAVTYTFARPVSLNKNSAKLDYKFNPIV